MKKVFTFITAFAMVSSLLASSLPNILFAAETEESDSYSMNVNVDISDKGKPISPYIFGINEHGIDHNTTIHSLRQGGNRFTAYNWETNYSNAGADWKNTSDDTMSKSQTPAACATRLSSQGAERNVAYKLVTLQMAGYVSADKDGIVSADEVAPSKRWNKVKFKKDGELSLKPDLTDGVVYMDEYVNYLIKTLGDSKSKKGFQGYSLDNEPALWSHTHSLVHPDKLTCKELIDKSVEVSKMVKSLDKNAEIFGPALYGYSAYDYLEDSEAWKADLAGKYDWFISYYLDMMKKAEEENGERLLDVLDIHYYSEAQGPCGTRRCSNPKHPECIDEMLQSYRTLCEKGYAENSWIGKYRQKNIPILPRMQESIQKYYPGTKLGITEYCLGGGDHIAGGIAEIDALGTFAKNDVYFATLWSEGGQYQYSGIDMFTNYDGKGSAFGDTLIESHTDDYIRSTSYASVNGDDKGDVTLIVTNKSQTQTEKAKISLDNTDIKYKNAAVYILSGKSTAISEKESLENIDGNTFTIDIPPLAAVQILVTDDEDSYRYFEPPMPDTSLASEKICGKFTGKGKSYTVNFDDEMGKSLIIDVELGKGITIASGAADFTVKYDGKDYWVACTWTTRKSGEVTIDLSKPSSATSSDNVKSYDEKLLAEIGKILQKRKSAEVQVWYVANSKFDAVDASNVAITNIYMNKECTVDTYGDLNADRKIDITDLSILSLNLIGDITLSDDILKYADVTGDGVVNLADLPHLKQYIMKDPVILGPHKK